MELRSDHVLLFVKNKNQNQRPQRGNAIKGDHGSGTRHAADGSPRGGCANRVRFSGSNVRLATESKGRATIGQHGNARVREYRGLLVEPAQHDQELL